MDEAIEEAQDGVSASRMLDEIGQAVEQVGLVGELAAGTKLFRGRVGPSRRPYRSPPKLGPLPEVRTVAKRMSVTGIPRQSHTRTEIPVPYTFVPLAYLQAISRACLSAWSARPFGVVCVLRLAAERFPSRKGLHSIPGTSL